ncbi:OsmC family protein [Hoeflea sp. YIM 152468]|uniref:OsmC family protein n=1 Tax=Hoeflea sp. YIM 152468 TaxID=3031759 RepID=UPI0023DC900C|nr:OsmC family protein [Hoeflea sp. YIM 152468]MDF1608598.1 OsmC family protein [Hoeflea sp. YIM 152468]
MVKIKPKQFGPVNVLFDGADAVTFAQADLTQAQQHPPRSSPVVTLLASLGHCLVESIRIIARREDLALAPFTISITAEKTLDLPGRLKGIRCVVHGNPVADPRLALGLVTNAKSICTVSNSLDCDTQVTLSQSKTPG